MPSPFLTPSGPRLRAAPPTVLLQLFRIQRSLAERGEDCLAQLVHFGFTHPQLGGDFHVGAGERLSNLEAEREIAGRQDVSAAPGAGEFVDRQLFHRAVGTLAGDAGPREQPQVGPGAANRPRPTGCGEHFGRR